MVASRCPAIPDSDKGENPFSKPLREGRRSRARPFTDGVRRSGDLRGRRMRSRSHACGLAPNLRLSMRHEHASHDDVYRVGRPWNRRGGRAVSACESDRWAAEHPIEKNEMNSMPRSDEQRPIRLTSFEAASYTEFALGVHERAWCAQDSARWVTEKGTDEHEGVREKGQS